MGAEELLAMIGLVIAIIAFVSEKNREYLVLKFSNSDVLWLLLGFAFLHFLVSFDWLLENWCKRLSYFTHKKGIPAFAWAYLLTLVLIALTCYKVFFAFFPKSNKHKVINFYEKLNLNMEQPFLLNLLEKFHKKDIIDYLDKYSKVEVDVESEFDYEKKFTEAYKKTINTNRLDYASAVYNKIILDEVFLSNVANVYPYFFTDFISKLNKKSFSNEEFINKYFSIMMKSKNHHFFREIRNTQNQGEGSKYRLEKEHKILLSLFKDIKVSENNHVWQAIANSAIWEIEEESEKPNSFFRKAFDERDKVELWNTRIMIAIHFFDIMIREAIFQKATWHMWLFYYESFVRVLLENIPAEDIAQHDINHYQPTINHKLIQEIIENQCDWLRVAENLKVENLVIDTCKCIGQCLYLIALSSKISEAVKIEAFDKVLLTYFKFSEREKTELQIKWLEKALTEPIMGFNITSGDSHRNKSNFFKALSLAWGKFDKVPYEYNDSIQTFEEKIINTF